MDLAAVGSFSRTSRALAEHDRTLTLVTDDMRLLRVLQAGRLDPAAAIRPRLMEAIAEASARDRLRETFEDGVAETDETVLG
jgi:hypothetical protein